VCSSFVFSIGIEQKGVSNWATVLNHLSVLLGRPVQSERELEPRAFRAQRRTLVRRTEFELVEQLFGAKGRRKMVLPPGAMVELFWVDLCVC